MAYLFKHRDKFTFHLTLKVKVGQSAYVYILMEVEKEELKLMVFEESELKKSSVLEVVTEGKSIMRSCITCTFH
jgi:2'-5' RNA ligase